MKLRFVTVIILALIASPVALAQDYSFSVPRMMLGVTPNKDASVDLRYTVEFSCNQGAHAIDIVDVGLPHSDYDIGNMMASVNDHQVYDIRTSTEIDIGVEVHLGDYAIQPGESATFIFTCTMPNLIFQDTTRKDYASLQITPTWWGSQYVTGTTELGIVIDLPESVELDEALYQKEAFAEKITLDDGSKAVVWYWDDTRADGPHLVGVSFPKHDYRVVRMTKLMLLWKWWKENPVLRFMWAPVLFVLLGIFFFRLTNGTGISVFIFLLGFSAIAFAISPFLEAIALPVLIPVWWIAERSRTAARRSYLPPIASVEAGGIKRGLTVPEAAVIMELPLGKVLTLVVFGLMKKGLVRQTQEDPLAVEVPEEYHGSRSERQRAARENGTVIHAYEQPFLDAFEENPGTPIAELNLQEPMKGLIEKAADRMSGFNLKETRDYYESIVYGAWTEAKAIGELDARTEFVDDNLLWLMLAPDYDDTFATWHRSGYHYRPTWSQPSGGVGLPVPATVTTGGRTTTGDVAASFAGWAENTAGNLAGTLDPVSLGLGDRGGLNLSGVDKVTLDVLESMAESSGSGGGGGGCACAGCACACACAGGGR